MTRIKQTCICILLCVVGLLGGCRAPSVPETENGSEREFTARQNHGFPLTSEKQYWKSAGYTLAEINAKFHPEFYNDEREFKPDDVSNDALTAYNIMLGYAENVIGKEYYVYDYYYADWTDPPHSWLIKIVPLDMAKAAEKAGVLYFDQPLTMFCKEDGSEVNSTIEPYLMEKKWFAALSQQLSDSFPEYETELEISEFCALYPDILTEKFPDPSDYTYLINEEFYDKLPEWEYGNIVNIGLPEKTDKSGAAYVFEQLKPTLMRYCVSECRICEIDEDGYFELIETFALTGE